MSRVLHAIEKGIRITAENGAAVVDFLHGSGAPGGDTGEQDDAPLSSLYFRDDGKVYRKKYDNNEAADWIIVGEVLLEDLKWRQEKVRAATNDTLTAGNTNPTTWTDNDKGLSDDDFAVNDRVLSDVDGTPTLFKVTAINQGVGSDEITLAAETENPLADGDKMIVRHYLPDSGASQEDGAFVLYGSGSIIKVADVDWEFADGIKLPATYASQNGSITNADTVNSAIQKLDGNQQDLQTLSGVSQGSVNLGAFSSPASLLMAATYTVKAALQRLGDLLAQLRGVQITGVTTEASVDEVPTATVKCCKWLVESFEEATPANRQCFEIFAATDGTNVDDTVYAKLKLGSSFNLTISVDVSGGNMRLRAASTSGGVTLTARRIEVVKNVL